MGIPKFYRWISERYPLINEVVTRSSAPEFDCLYLDMNGIIHNCTHPEDLDVTKVRLTEEQMFARIFEYIDRIFHLIKPKRLLFMAVDGVAPRAKMNQQRQRRFKSAKEMKEQLEMAQNTGHTVHENVFDSNCITPGTEFMEKVATHLRFFVRSKMQNDRAWRNIRVILSGPDVPGEGEHKIMLYIRRMKMKSGYPSNLRHCLYGLDADLIMLGLVSHEPHFALLREEVIFGRKQKQRTNVKQAEKFQLLHLSLLREYLSIEYKGIQVPVYPSEEEKDAKETKKEDEAPQGPTKIERDDSDDDGGNGDQAAEEIPGEITKSSVVPKAKEDANLRDDQKRNMVLVDTERVVDDFVFLCFFVGNDFIPNLPMLDIAEDGLNRIFEHYKTHILPQHGYVTQNGTVNPNPARELFKQMAKIESPILNRRFNDEAWLRQKMQQGGGEGRGGKDGGMFRPKKVDEAIKAEAEFVQAVEVAQSGKGLLKDDGGVVLAENVRYYRKKFPEFFRDEEGRIRDAAESKRMIENLCEKYWEGLNWVLLYYYQGCAAWGWYFPFHYAPMSAEMATVAPNQLRIPKFEEGKPYRPLEQLLSVLPPASKKFLPLPYRELVEKGSPLKAWYPDEFKEDQNFKKAPWEAIALIPFLDESKLLGVIRESKCEARLSAAERRRNEPEGRCYLYRGLISRDRSSVPRGGRRKKKEKQDEEEEEKRENEAVVPSTLPRLFPSIRTPLSEERVWPFPTKDRPFEPKVPPGCKRPAVGFPCISYLQPSGCLENGGVNLFGFATRRPSLMLSLKPVVFPTSRLAQHFFAKNSQNKRLAYVGWPRLVESVVVAINDGKNLYSANGTRKLGAAECENFRRKAAGIANRYKSKMGVKIGEVKVILSVLPFLRMAREPSGAVTKRFGQVAQEHPGQAVLLRNPRPDPRHQEELALRPLSEEYPVGSQVIYLGGRGRGKGGTSSRQQPQHKGERGECKHELFGAVAKVKGYVLKGKKLELDLISPSDDSESLELFRKATRDARKAEERYFSEMDVAKALQLSQSVLSRIADSLNFNPGFRNVGLRLRSSRRREMVLGWTRWNWKRSSWEYSARAIKVLLEYKSAFPRVLLHVHQSKYSHAYNAEDIVDTVHGGRGSRDQAIQAIRRIESWIASRGLDRLPACPSTSRVLPLNGIQAVVRLTDAIRDKRRRRAGSSFNNDEEDDHAQEEEEEEEEEEEKDAEGGENEQEDLPPGAILKKGGDESKGRETQAFAAVPRSLVYARNPYPAWSPSNRFNPGDRVVSLRDDRGMAFGALGTIIAVHKISELSEPSPLGLDLLLDVPTPAAGTLAGRVPEGRGISVSAADVLNLSQNPV